MQAKLKTNFPSQYIHVYPISILPVGEYSWDVEIVWDKLKLLFHLLVCRVSLPVGEYSWGVEIVWDKLKLFIPSISL